VTMSGHTTNTAGQCHPALVGPSESDRCGRGDLGAPFRRSVMSPARYTAARLPQHRGENTLPPMIRIHAHPGQTGTRHLPDTRVRPRNGPRQRKDAVDPRERSLDRNRPPPPQNDSPRQRQSAALPQALQEPQRTVSRVARQPPTPRSRIVSQALPREHARRAIPGRIPRARHDRATWVMCGRARPMSDGMSFRA
jgi:hypothetical protein